MFDDIIRDKANKHEAPVPPGAWDNIVRQKRKRRFPFFWWASALPLILCIAAGLYYNSTDRTPKNTLAEKSQATNSSSKQPTSNESQQQPAIQNNNAETKVVAAGKNELKTGNEMVAVEEKQLNSATNVATTTNNRNALSNSKAVKQEVKKNLTAEDKKSALVAGNRISKKTKGRAVFKNEGATTTEDNEVQAPQKQAIIFTDAQADKKQEAPVAVDITQQQIALNTPPAKKDINIKTNESNNKNTPPPGDKKENANNTKKSTHRSWFMEVSAAPLLPIQQYDQTVSFNRTLFLNNSLSVFSAKLVSTSIEPAVAFQLALKKELSTKLLMSIGLQYMLLKEHITLSGTETNTSYNTVNRLVNGIDGPRLVTDSVAVVTEGTRNITAINSYRLFSIPVLMQYSWIQKKRWSIGAVGGLYVNFSSSYQNAVNSNAATPLTVTPVAADKSSIGLDVFAGLRLAKTFGKKLDFFAMPSIRWNLGKYNIKNSLLNKTINQAGLSVGLCYKIK